GLLGWALGAGARQPGPQAQRGALLRAVVGAGRPHARVRADAARDLGFLAAGHAPEPDRQALPLHVHDAVLQSGPDRAPDDPDPRLGRDPGDVPPPEPSTRRSR